MHLGGGEAEEEEEEEQEEGKGGLKDKLTAPFFWVGGRECVPGGTLPSLGIMCNQTLNNGALSLPPLSVGVLLSLVIPVG